MVIDGLNLEAVERATAAGLHALAMIPTGIALVTAGNYGGKLGPFHIHLRDVLSRYPRLYPADRTQIVGKISSQCAGRYN